MTRREISEAISAGAGAVFGVVGWLMFASYRPTRVFGAAQGVRYLGDLLYTFTSNYEEIPVHPKSFLPLTCLALLILILLPSVALAQADLDRAQAHLDSGEVDDALVLLDRLLTRDKKNAQAWLLRSTGRVMNGDLAGGMADLKKALKEDPTLRQGWLNLAGLEIAQSRFVEAEKALLEAQRLKPGSSDNALNLGAVQLMQGRTTEAAASFDTYLRLEGGGGEALYLVAANYALAGQAVHAVEHLRSAIAQDERLRLRARDDERFLTLNDLAYQKLLRTDSYKPPEGSHQVAAAFRVPYNPTDNRLVYAVLGALRQSKIPYNPKIEANETWALIWTDTLRVKVSNQKNGTGVVSLSAGAEAFGEEEWHRMSQALFRTVHDQLGI